MVFCMPLERIEQTSKTILFEEFCKESSEGMDNDELCPDLATLLKIENESDYRIKISQKLQVSSYQEFVEKFTPCIWESTMMIGNEPEFRYSVEKPRNNPHAKKVQLSTHEFYKMVLNLYADKSASGDNNYEFDYSMVEHLLSPKKVMDDVKQLRKELFLNYTEYLKLDESRKTERNERANKIKETRKSIASKYSNQSALIKLGLGDVEEKLLLLEAPKKDDGVPILGESSSRPCLMEFSETGDIAIVPLESTPEGEELEIINETGTKIISVIEKDYDKKTGINGNEYTRSLVTSLFAPNEDSTGLVTYNREELEHKRDQYTRIYKNMQEQFVNAISSVVEKMLNVKVFFDNASIDGKLQAPLLITNCKASALLEKEEIKAKFKIFLKETSDDTDNYKLWFAILPAIGDEKFLDSVAVGSDPDDDLDDFDLDEDISATDLISINKAKNMLDILKEHRIVTFFNYKACEKTGFYQFNGNIIRDYKEKLESVKGNPYAVFTYPNFTILPKRETNIQIGVTSGDYGTENREFLEMPGIYVDSSYVAAGLIVGTQNPSYLKKKGYNVKPNNPCVRFDIEEDNNRFMLPTTMNREGVGNWADGVEQAMSDDGAMFGFSFCGNTKYFENKKVNYTYVFFARNMDGKCIYTTLLKDFVEQYLKTNGVSVDNKYKPEDLKKFLNGEAEQWRLDSSRSPITNNILKDGEVIALEDGQMKISLNGTDNFVELNVEVSEN